jgi:hypothetical protein
MMVVSLDQGFESKSVVLFPVVVIVAAVVVATVVAVVVAVLTTPDDECLFSAKPNSRASSELCCFITGDIGVATVGAS